MPKPDAVKATAILVLGLLFPVLILAQAYLGLSSLAGAIDRSLSTDEVVRIFQRAKPAIQTANDYALFSQMFAENINQTIITNKQIIKVVVIEIGFAAMSLGLMFVMLGVSDGGGEGRVTWGGVSVDLKTASTGALVFLVGAAMATAGGVLKNEYKSMPQPQYVVVDAGGPTDTEVASLDAYRQCKADAGEAFPACFADLFSQINAERLK